MTDMLFLGLTTNERFLEVASSIAIYATAVAGLGIIWVKGVVPLWRLGRKFTHTIDIVYNLPEWQEEMNRRTAELIQNGGSSMKDDVRSLRSDVTELRTWQLEHNDLHAVTDPEGK